MELLERIWSQETWLPSQISAINQLCDFGQVPSPLWASVSDLHNEKVDSRGLLQL